MDKETKKLLLDKSIRQIEYYQEGFYLLYDNNEDELEDKRGESYVNDYQSKMNVMFNDGTLLSDKLYLDSWFDRVVPEVDGFYIKCKSRRIERRIDFNGAHRDEGYYLKYNCRILITDGYNYSVIDGLSHKVTGDFASIMWSDNGLWLVNMLSKGVYRSYFYGQGNEIIYYAHEILIKTGVIALLEKDNIWYSLDLSRNLLPCFKWIHQIEK